MNHMPDLRSAPKPSASFEGFGDLLTVRDSSSILQQSEATVRKLCREGVLPSVRIGRRIYVPRAQLAARVSELLAEGEV